MLRSEELCDVYISTGVVRVVQCRRLGWAGCVARMVFIYCITMLSAAEISQ